MADVFALKIELPKETKMRMMGVVMISLMISVMGCATSFTGSAHVENGRAGCETKCRGQGMQVAGMVYMGEYSSACVCEVPRASASSGRERLVTAAAGASGSAAGVIMQMASEDAQRNQTMNVH